MFSGRNTPLALLAAALILAFALTACGSSDSTSSSSSTTTSSAPTPSNGGAQVSTKKGSKQFLEKGSSTNELVEFGKEAPASEREAAAAVLAENLKAREDADFAAQCSTLTQVEVEHVATPRKAAAAEKACPQALEKLATPLSGSKRIRANTFNGELAALRVKGKEAGALYHGTDGKDYQVPMFKEGIRWTVAAIMATELNPLEAAKPSQPAKPQSTGPTG